MVASHLISGRWINQREARVPTVGDPTPRNPALQGLPSLPSGHERLPRKCGEAW
jgi:hypothetical protein